MGQESPFFTILKAPRATIRRIADENPRYHVNALIIGCGVATWLAAATASPSGLDPSRVIGPALSVGIVNLVLARMAAAYQCGIGAFFGGDASRAEVLCAVAWGLVPWIIVATIVTVTNSAVLGVNALLGERLNVYGTPVLSPLIEVVTKVGVLWTAGVMIACYAEVNRFSIVRSVAAALAGSAIAYVVFTVLVGLLAMTFFYFAPPVGVC